MAPSGLSDCRSNRPIALTPMSKTDTPTLSKKYQGVTDQTLSHGDPIEAGLRPSGMSKLKEHYESLPQVTHEGHLEKVGLTKSGHVVYRNVDTGAFIYYTISIRNEGPTTGRSQTYHGRTPHPSEPHDGFGDGWIISPDHDQPPDGDGI